MDFEKAEKISGAYGGFIECALTRLKAIFFTAIPESLLPYSVEEIKEAMNIFSNHHEKGNTKLLEAIHTTAYSLSYFIDDEKAILEATERFGQQSWHDAVISIIKNFRSTPDQKNYISGFFKDTQTEKINFENQNFSIAYKIVDIYATFLRNAHIRLSFIFSDKIPESFLPFPKNTLIKACEICAKAYSSIENEEKAELFIYGKRILQEDYTDDEIAISELIKNFSNKETRDSIISNIKDFQIKSARQGYIDLLFKDLLK